MKARYRTIALQAVGVAVLAAIVFLAFLRPSDPSELTGIEAGEGPAPVVVDPAPTPREDPPDPKRQDAGGQAGPAPETDEAAPASPPDTPVPAAPPAEPDGEASPPAGEGETPTGSQYDDLVGRLQARVAPSGELPALSPADQP